MSFTIAQFNILGRYMAGTMWFHYARDFLPKTLAAGCPDWYSNRGYPRCLLWKESDGDGRFYRLPVLMKEISALNADVICLVELDCFQEFRNALNKEGYDAVFRSRPGTKDGCGIFWRRDVFKAASASNSIVFQIPANDRVALAQPLQHLSTNRSTIVVCTHLHWDQAAGHQSAEAKELLSFIRQSESAAGGEFKGTTIVCGDLNTQPGSVAYDLLRKRLSDAAGTYQPGVFTSMKPDVFYYAWPRGCKNVPGAPMEWHHQEGRREILDYILYSEAAFEVEVPVKLPSLVTETGKPPYGFWAGGWSVAPSAGKQAKVNKHNESWSPARTHGDLQLGIPNRLHGSDHLPVSCRLRFRDLGGPSSSSSRCDPPDRKRKRTQE